MLFNSQQFLFITTTKISLRQNSLSPVCKHVTSLSNSIHCQCSSSNNEIFVQCFCCCFIDCFYRHYYLFATLPTTVSTTGNKQTNNKTLSLVSYTAITVNLNIPSFTPKYSNNIYRRLSNRAQKSNWFLKS